MTVSKFQALINDTFMDKATVEIQWQDLHAMNRRVAKIVMGWDYVKHDPNEQTPHGVYMKGGVTVAQHDWSPMTEMADAWDVWQRLAELGYILMVTWGSPVGHRPVTIIQAVDPGNAEVFKQPIAKEAPPMEMVCYAALRILAGQQQ